MEVLHVGKYYPPHYGGMETVVRDLCECLHDKVELTAVVANDDSSRRQEIRNGVSVVRLANLSTIASQPITPELVPLLRRATVDIVHVHEPNPLAMTASLLLPRTTDIVVHYHSDIVRQRLLRHVYRPLLDMVLGRARAIIVGSHELVESSPVLDKWRQKCRVVPFGLDLRRFEASSAWGRSAPGRNSRVLAVGRLTYYKGFEYLIRAMAEVEAELTIAGEGQLRSELEQLARDLGIAHRVRLVGRVNDVELMSLYQDTDVFCLPSCECSEAFGLVAVEAMACGIPVVSTDLPTGVRSVNLDGQTGFVVPTRAPAALASAIRRLLADADLRARLGANGRRRAQTVFDRRVMSNHVLSIYRELRGLPN